jgi:hypothetical protein
LAGAVPVSSRPTMAVFSCPDSLPGRRPIGGGGWRRASVSVRRCGRRGTELPEGPEMLGTKGLEEWDSWPQIREQAVRTVDGGRIVRSETDEGGTAMTMSMTRQRPVADPEPGDDVVEVHRRTIDKVLIGAANEPGLSRCRPSSDGRPPDPPPAGRPSRRDFDRYRRGGRAPGRGPPATPPEQARPQPVSRSTGWCGGPGHGPGGPRRTGGRLPRLGARRRWRCRRP